MIKAICFDATETLIRLPKGVACHYQLVAKQHGFELNETDLAAAFRAAWRAAPARAAIGTARPDDDKGWWKCLVSDVLARCGAGVAADRFPALFEELYAHFILPGVWDLHPDVLPMLETLASRDRYRLAVVSNFDRRLLTILAQLGIRDHFHAIVLSSEAGADKPDPQIFARALSELRVQPHEALHVGDDPVHDWQGAAAAGLHVFPLDRKSNSLLDVPAFAAALDANAVS